MHQAHRFQMQPRLSLRRRTRYPAWKSYVAPRAPAALIRQSGNIAGFVDVRSQITAPINSRRPEKSRRRYRLSVTVGCSVAQFQNILAKAGDDDQDGQAEGLQVRVLPEEPSLNH